MSGPEANAAGPTGPWSARFLARVESLGLLRLDPSPAAAGPTVSELSIAAGSVGARVSGSGGRDGSDEGVSYDVWVELAVFEPRQWARAEQAIAADHEVREALMDGEMPARLEGVLARAGLSLLPARATDLTLECSCPQWSACRHLTAVLIALAAAFDVNPFLLLAWRGRDRDRLLRHLGELRSAAKADLPGSPGTPGSPRRASPAGERPLAERLDDFWSEGEPQGAPPRPSEVAASAEPAPARLGPSGIVIRGRSLEALLRPAYEALVD